MWAVGVMLLELLTGRCAYTGMCTRTAPVDTATVAAVAAPEDTALAPVELEKLRKLAAGKGCLLYTSDAADE